MTPNEKSIQVWSPSDLIIIPSGSQPEEIVEFAKPQLSSRDMKSIVTAFQAESYEMVATFVWTKASAVLKKQIATLGMDFVGEMLGRPDLDEDSDPATSIADHEAISLAEDLCLITSTQGLRLKHVLELVTHFTELEQEAAEQEMMAREEALILLKTCIASILGKPNFETAIKFADFRKALGKRTLKPDDGGTLAITGAPYFFIRTTLSVLLSLVKTGKGAVQEHAIGNVSVLLPLIWPKLREPERWQIGQAYAEVNSEGDRAASAGLKKSLLKVHGFDYVPESLRSNTFSEAAARVLAAHFGFNNFHNEQEPMAILASLGTAIPRPAFAKCMEATLAVWLGNSWGVSFAAAPSARKLLDSLRSEQWEYYFNECLRRDRTVLDKLSGDTKPMQRWKSLISAYNPQRFSIRELSVRKLLNATTMDTLRHWAEQLRNNVNE
ncbi:MAG TPA: hypothetical protein VK738_11825 [Terriglobales bacterium]|jgi:hypothetical protein|nr:hypothetical protein [Terriglobales bacterium]